MIEKHLLSEVLDKPRLYMDLNGFWDVDLIVLSVKDKKIDSHGNEIAFYDGLEVSLYCDDEAEDIVHLADGKIEFRQLSENKKRWCALIENYELISHSELKQRKPLSDKP